MISWKDENILAGFLFLCLICHGMFFAREWLVLGTFIMVYRATAWTKGSGRGSLIDSYNHIQDNQDSSGPSGTTCIFLVLIALSLCGLFHPVRAAEGWLDGFRWLLFMSFYLWGKQLAATPETRKYILNRILFISFLGTLLAWLPGSGWLWLSPGTPQGERFAATFGYPNAAAVLMGCQLLFMFKEKKPILLLMVVPIISLISTGSRGAVVLLIFLSTVIFVKRFLIKIDAYKISEAEGLLGFRELNINIQHLKALCFLLLLILLQQTMLRYQGSVDHLINWSYASFAERLQYYCDSLKLARAADFLPRAGGWLAFPFVQTSPYWTLYPHSSLSRIMLNQGIAGVVILVIWAGKGLKGYLKDLCQADDLTLICGKTAALYLGLHSLMDVDISFGFLGIIFWLLVGMFSK